MRRQLLAVTVLAWGCASDDGELPDGPTGDGAGGTSAGDTGSTTTSSTGAATTTGGATSTGATTTTREPGVCDFACEVFFACTTSYDSVEDCVPGCLEQFEPGGNAEASPCREATEGWLTCIAGLDCAQYDEWSAGDPNGVDSFPCKDETLAQRDAC